MPKTLFTLDALDVTTDAQCAGVVTWMQNLRMPAGVVGPNSVDHFSKFFQDHQTVCIAGM